MKELGDYMEMTPIEGSYLLFLNLGKYNKDKSASKYLAKKCNIMVNAGETFDSEFNNWVRINLATSLSNVKKAVKNANDQFMKAAACRGCSEPEDYDVMFESLNEPPTRIGDLIEIKDFPEDEDLDTAMKTKSSDEKVREDFKSLYYEMHGREKRDIKLLKE